MKDCKDSPFLSGMSLSRAFTLAIIALKSLCAVENAGSFWTVMRWQVSLVSTKSRLNVFDGVKPPSAFMKKSWRSISKIPLSKSSVTCGPSKKNWPRKKVTKLTRREFRVVRVVRVLHVLRILRVAHQHWIERLCHVGFPFWMSQPHGCAVIDQLSDMRKCNKNLRKCENGRTTWQTWANKALYLLWALGNQKQAKQFQCRLSTQLSD